ncbi:GroES-like protein [Mycena venus]|uniref:GroES-like protein n=1 Tax=Mycena venus TaxID=2733690 RepID=A0A8H6XML3_9AGAR|nr:GroES-like protein [Mycena venus]
MVPTLAQDVPTQRQLSDVGRSMIDISIRTRTSSWARSIRGTEFLELKNGGHNSLASISGLDLESHITDFFARCHHTADALPGEREERGHGYGGVGGGGEWGEREGRHPSGWRISNLHGGEIKVKGTVSGTFKVEDYQAVRDKMNSHSALKIAIEPMSRWVAGHD